MVSGGRWRAGQHGAPSCEGMAGRPRDTTETSDTPSAPHFYEQTAEGNPFYREQKYRSKPRTSLFL